MSKAFEELWQENKKLKKSNEHLSQVLHEKILNPISSFILGLGIGMILMLIILKLL